jgi:hypothetical protein
MPWRLYYEIQSVLPAVLYSDRYDTKEEALEKAFEYFSNPSHGISVLRLDSPQRRGDEQSKDRGVVPRSPVSHIVGVRLTSVPRIAANIAKDGF